MKFLVINRPGSISVKSLEGESMICHVLSFDDPAVLEEAELEYHWSSRIIANGRYDLIAPEHKGYLTLYEKDLIEQMKKYYRQYLEEQQPASKQAAG